MWTNTVVRRRGWGRGKPPRGPGVRTFMLAAVLVVGIVVVVMALVVLVVRLAG